MLFSKDDKINALVTEKQKLGWQVRKGKKHHVLIAPNGRKMAIPSSPSDYRAYRNFARDVKRFLEEGQDMRAA